MSALILPVHLLVHQKVSRASQTDSNSGSYVALGLVLLNIEI